MRVVIEMDCGWCLLILLSLSAVLFCCPWNSLIMFSDAAKVLLGGVPVWIRKNLRYKSDEIY